MANWSKDGNGAFTDTMGASLLGAKRQQHAHAARRPGAFRTHSDSTHEEMPPCHRAISAVTGVFSGRDLTKTFSSAARRPRASAPVRTAASPRLDTSTRGGYG